jgi:undecaprenol kinase/diacylglycerol kinase (ATP)
MTVNSTERGATRSKNWLDISAMMRGWWYIANSAQHPIHAGLTGAAAAVSGQLTRIEWRGRPGGGAGVAAEFANTAFETLVDLAVRIHRWRVVKDVAAAGVLVSAGAAVLVGLLIMGPPLWERVISLLQPLLSTR